MTRTPLLEMTVPGNPVPKARPRVLRSGIVYTPTTTRIYEQNIGLHARRQWSDPVLTQPELGISIQFARTAMRGDLDNLVKAVMDGLQGIIFRNDSQIWHLEATQFRATKPCTRIEIWVISKGDRKNGERKSS